MNRRNLTGAAVFCFLVLLGAGSRLLVKLDTGYPWNFHAIIAVALFAGFYFRSAATAACVPLMAMLLSDQVLGGYEPAVMAAVYGGLLFPILWRSVLRDRLSPLRIGGAAISSSLFFFLVSNFGVWMWGQALHGPSTLSRCYVEALPFFKNEVAGDLLFSAVLFGAYLLMHPATKKSAAKPEAIARAEA